MRVHGETFQHYSYGSEQGIIIDAIKSTAEVSTHRGAARNCISRPSQGKLDPRSMSWEDFTERCWEDPDRVISRALFMPVPVSVLLPPASCVCSQL